MKLSEQKLRCGQVIGLGLALALGMGASISQAASIGLAPHTGSFSGGGNGNTFQDTAVDSAGDTVTMTLSAWSWTGSTWQTAILQSFGTNGFGVCNQKEQTACTSPNHTVDNWGNTDFVLIEFDKAVTQAQVRITPFGPAFDGDDTDVSYFWGNGDADLDGANLNNIALPNQTNDNGPAFSSRNVPIQLAGIANPTDWILFGASLPNADGRFDEFKIKSVGFQTPIPAAAILFGTGLSSLLVLARRSAKKA